MNNLYFKVKKREDIVLYLWRAHNRVNERLAKEEKWNRDKQDSVFRKQQFPPKFLCPNCEYNQEEKVN